ncbi:MAG TPA: divalent-cation tolerance protein CutA [Leptolyngbyaceae cyanobacterium M33_DOE_097]|uniref:Divalent-cation tolerance protein CutA n=1 Tax=Oscillatoriales cyanobacterium SpSt-418 TaxID=2282169 RepID=A0A7C3KD33_9CYAN|nr:divalent-cation tolerance protein CutA [Leptolyngbyaceae cyanobacterium M33_DOE_097]
MEYGVVLVTASSEAEANAIAQSLVESHLAACVSLFPIQSIYTWQGKVEQAQEWQLLIKTDLTRFAELEAAVRSLHSYEVPEIIALPISHGSTDYLQWIGAQVKPQ